MCNNLLHYQGDVITSSIQFTRWLSINYNFTLLQLGKKPSSFITVKMDIKGFDCNPFLFIASPAAFKRRLVY